MLQDSSEMQKENSNIHIIKVPRLHKQTASIHLLYITKGTKQRNPIKSIQEHLK